MKRQERTQILIEGSKELAKELADQILTAYEVKTVEKPNYGLTMIKVRETAKKELFYLGEVLVTEAKVILNEQIGLGIVAGHQPELAYHLAVIDAAYGIGAKETKSWEDKLKKELEKIQDNRLREHNKLMATKVNFETMSI